MRQLSLPALFLLLLVIITLFSGWNSSFAPPSMPSDRLTVGTTAKIRTLDPADSDNFFSSHILANTTERLYDYQRDSTELMPVLAKDFPTVSADGLTYTIPVRTGIKFHDGSEFNAQAMAFSLNRFLTLKGSPYQRLSVIKSVTAVADDRLVIELHQPVSFLPRLLAFAGASAISPKSYSDKEFLPDRVIGTGAYKLASYTESNSLKLDKFADYWGEKPANAGVDIQFFSAPANLLNAFKTGQIDVAFQTLSPAQVTNLQQNAAKNDWQVASNEGSTMLFMVLNLQVPPLDNPLVRQAIAHAIDRPLLAERIFQGQRQPVYSMIPTTFQEYQPLFPQYQPDQAQKLLQKAGYSLDRPAQTSIWYSPKYAGNGDLVASYLKAILEKSSGGLLQIKIEPIDTTIADTLLDKGTYTYPIFLRDWVPDYLDPDNFLEPFFTCARANAQGLCAQGNTAYWGSFYYNAKINDLIAQQRKVHNPQARGQLISQIQQIIAQDAPFIPLWQNREYAFSHKHLTGVQIEPSQQLRYQYIRRTSPSQ